MEWISAAFASACFLHVGHQHLSMFVFFFGPQSPGAHGCPPASLHRLGPHLPKLSLESALPEGIVRRMTNEKTRNRCHPFELVSILISTHLQIWEQISNNDKKRSNCPVQPKQSNNALRGLCNRLSSFSVGLALFEKDNHSFFEHFRNKLHWKFLEVPHLVCGRLLASTIQKYKGISLGNSTKVSHHFGRCTVAYSGSWILSDLHGLEAGRFREQV